MAQVIIQNWMKQRVPENLKTSFIEQMLRWDRTFLHQVTYDEAVMGQRLQYARGIIDAIELNKDKVDYK